MAAKLLKAGSGAADTERVNAISECDPAPAAPPVEDTLAASYRATAIAAGGASTTPFLEEALGQLARLTRATRCSILLVQDGRLRRGASTGLSDEYLEAIDGVAITPTTGACGAAAATGRPCLTADISTDPKWAGFRGATEAAGVRACWSVPVALPDGRVLATFATYATRPGLPEPSTVAAVEEYAPIVALGLESISRQRELADNAEAIVLALTSALDSRDEYTAAHSAETSALVARVGARLGLGPSELECLARVGTLHDIGKLGVPTEILAKPGPLDPEEWRVMRTHPVVGERILSRVPFLEDVARAVRHEHERWDGTGYPDGLSGERIPLASRIVFVCDSYHAMTSDRPYRSAMAAPLAEAELRAHAGSQFDPTVVSALLEELDAPARPAPPNGRTVRARAREHALTAIASRLGACDVFVFRAAADGQWCHLDGIGRGSGWAGNVVLEAGDEPHLRAVLAAGGPVVLDGLHPVRVVGPYFAAGAALVLAPHGELVVFGGGARPLAAADPKLLRELAERAARAVWDVPSAKRLDDELEVLDAVRAVTTVAADALPAALGAIASCAAQALSCEFAAVATVPAAGLPATVGRAGPGWSPAREGTIREALEALAACGTELPLLIQDTSEQGARAVTGFTAGDGITALHVLPIGNDPVAVMLVAHASTAPRGFTMLCRRVAAAVADAAEVVVRRAVAQERLTAENQALAKRVATDALTGVASRGWWEERLASGPAGPGDADRRSAVVVVDLDDLKKVNDSLGHHVGDQLLRSCARLLRERCGPRDRVARIGGDEFVVVLADAGGDDAEAWCEELRGAAAGACRQTDPDMAFSLGWGVTTGAGLYEALAQADERMYADKRARHAEPPELTARGRPSAPAVVT